MTGKAIENKPIVAKTIARFHHPIRNSLRTTGRSKMFWAISYTGLADRLLTILTCQQWARECGRSFQFSWLPHPHCRCRWDYLFRQNPIIVSAPPNQITFDLTTNRELKSLTALKNCLKGGDDTIALKCYTIRPPDIQLHQFRENFQPIAPTACRISAIRKQMGPGAIGVHVRRGDLTRTEYVLASIDQFVEATHSLRRKHPHLEYVFLATDDGAPTPYGFLTKSAGVESRFRDEFKDRLIVAPKMSLDRNDPMAITDAVVDLWSLRNCGAVVGTRQSCFSFLAATGRPNLML